MMCHLRLIVVALAVSGGAAVNVQHSVDPGHIAIPRGQPLAVEDSASKNRIVSTVSTYLRGTKTVLTEQKAQNAEESSMFTRVLTQLLFGIVYYFLIVSKYPEYPKGLTAEAIPAEAKALQEENEVMAIFKTSFTNNCLAFCCTGPRAAHTFHTTDVLNYWVGLFAMTCFPCCTLMFTNSVTDLNEKLGGEKRNLIMSALCACFCPCCVVAQDAEALDIVTGQHTGLFGISERTSAVKDDTSAAS